MSVCTTKERFEHRADALAVAKRISARGNRSVRSGANAYHCDECGGWHVYTSRGHTRVIKRGVA